MKSLLIAILISSLVGNAHAITGPGVKSTTGKGVDGAPPPIDGVNVDGHGGLSGGGFQNQRPLNPTGGIPLNIIGITNQDSRAANNLWQAVQRLNYAKDMNTVDQGFQQLLDGLNRTGLLNRISPNGALNAIDLFQALCLDAAQNPLLAEKFMQMNNQKRSSVESDPKEPNPLAKEPPKEWKEIRDKDGKPVIDRVEIRNQGSEFRKENTKLFKMPATDTAKGKGSSMPATDTARGKNPQSNPSPTGSDKASPPRVSLFASMTDFLRMKSETGASPVRKGAAEVEGLSSQKGSGKQGNGEGSSVDGDSNFDFPPPLGEGCFNSNFGNGNNNNNNNNINDNQRQNPDPQADDEDDDKDSGGDPDDAGKRRKPFQMPQIAASVGGKGGGGRGGGGDIPQFPNVGPLAGLAVPPSVSESCYVCPAIMAITNSMSASQFNSAQWAASLQASQDAFAATMSASIEAFGQSIAPFGAGAYRGVASTGAAQQPLLGNPFNRSQRGGLNSAFTNSSRKP